MVRQDLIGVFLIGVVEDNVDPSLEGRVKVRVVNIYDDIPLTSIPWAKPWKDLNGNVYNVPDIGKVVSVMFDHGNTMMPEYVCSEIYNVNIENKLKKMASDDVKSFKSIFLDHSTQIFRTNSDGLKIDHEYSNINLDPYGNILINIRDDKSIISLGSKDANESAVLGNTFMEWMDTLIDNLLGSKDGPYLGNLMAPVMATPQMIECLTQYKTLRENFISDHVKISKNGSIISQTRDYLKQFGDNYKNNSQSTLTTTEQTPYSPKSNYTPSELENNPASIDKYDPSKGEGNSETPIPYKGNATDKQKSSIRIAVEATLSLGEFHGKCSRYTYNIAISYTNLLKSSTANVGAGFSAGGNAKDNGYFDSLVKLGYKKNIIGTLSKEQIIQNLSKDFDIGDVVSYYGMDNTNNSYSRYGHTQIFTGGLQNGSGGHKWSTDNRQNYQSSFVYRSKPCDQWYFVVFKAPTG